MKAKSRPQGRKGFFMNRQELIKRFESEMAKVKRPGADKLMEYIRKRDFYTAPASTKYHLSCEGGLLQHSLNVLDALRGLLVPKDPQGTNWIYKVAGKNAAVVSDESVIVTALLHDICKTYFYGTSLRNAKNEKTGAWEKVPFYTVNDKMPLGHGAKSAMIIKQYMEINSMEMYAIWHHMGFNGNMENDACVGLAIEKYPFVLALQTADMQASRIMETEAGNKENYTENADVGAKNTPSAARSSTATTGQSPGAMPKAKAKQEATDNDFSDFDDMDFQEAPSLPTEPQEVN